MEIHNKLINMLGDAVPSKTMGCKCAPKCKNGHKDESKDNCHSGSPKSATTLDIRKILHKVLED